MSTLGKFLYLTAVIVVLAVGVLIQWDGDTERLERVRAFAGGKAPVGELLVLNRPWPDPPRAPRTPLEFFDLVERDFPAAFARHFDAPSTAGMSNVYMQARDRGREVYIREGCFHCHSMYVRAETRDADRWGRASVLSGASVRRAGLPPAGLRRVGPDLANESGRRSNDWQAAHLLRPQSVLKDSIMPGYPWLFEEAEGRLQPNRDGLALIVYLQSLGTERP